LSTNLQESLLHPAWWAHYLILVGFTVFVPYSKHLHILTSAFNVFFRRSRPSGELRRVDIENVEGFGAFEVEGFTRKQLLDTYTCTHCGRCDVSCPAFLSGKSLSPSKILAEVKDDLFRSCSVQTVDSSIKLPVHDIEAVFSCTTCGACVEVCPVYNRPMELITEMRRGLVYEGVIDEKHQEALQATCDYGNPGAVIPQSKESLLDLLGLEKAVSGKKYDVLYWLGCSAYSDERTQDIIRNVLQILNKAGLSVAALGEKENCCGDFVRRLGDEGMFQQLAKENIKVITEIDHEVLLTHCPHGYNTFKNEYTQFGADFNVIHHTDFIFGLIQKNILAIRETELQVLYHDPCYLGRHNAIYDSPRSVLSSVAQEVVEFGACKNKSLCCGAGGGHMWKHETEGTKMSDNRIEEALLTEVKTIATSCPFCLAMFEDSLTVKGLTDDIQVKDISEVVAEALC
jgi:Fe-S oxidoreductase